MKQAVSVSLRSKAIEVAKIFSGSGRDKNFNNELFSVTTIIPYSEHSAAVSFTKKPSNKLALAFFYFNNGKWFYFFPDDSVIQGMFLFAFDKQKVENANFQLSGLGINPSSNFVGGDCC